jgi:hypothetical protein
MAVTNGGVYKSNGVHGASGEIVARVPHSRLNYQPRRKSLHEGFCPQSEAKNPSLHEFLHETIVEKILRFGLFGFRVLQGNLFQVT